MSENNLFEKIQESASSNLGILNTVYGDIIIDSENTENTYKSIINSFSLRTNYLKNESIYFSKIIHDLLLKYTKILFNKYNFIDVIYWNQYLPSYNDGDPCVFMKSEVAFKIINKYNELINQKPSDIFWKNIFREHEYILHSASTLYNDGEYSDILSLEVFKNVENPEELLCLNIDSSYLYANDSELQKDFLNLESILQHCYSNLEELYGSNVNVEFLKNGKVLIAEY